MVDSIDDYKNDEESAIETSLKSEPIIIDRTVGCVQKQWVEDQ